MLELIKIKKIYPLKFNDVIALKDVSLIFREKEFVSILGPSGCGKTTMLNIIGGLDRYTEGDLRIEGISTKEFKDPDWDQYRNHRIGFVFQNYHLIPHLSVIENVALALTLSGETKSNRLEKAKKALVSVGLSDQLKEYPANLSGGQQQRAAIARALAMSPEIILFDEPTSALDPELESEVVSVIKKLASEDRTMILVTHDMKLAKEISDYILFMDEGIILEKGTPDVIFNNTKTDRLKKFLESVSFSNT